METNDTLERLWRHAVWADTKLLESIRRSGGASAEALAELAHILGAYEVWLARLEHRDSRAAVWPESSLEELETLFDRVQKGYAEYLASLAAGDPKEDEVVTYSNSAGQSFSSSVGDILLHVALHAQYHRGKINLMLRGAGAAPAPTDYIAYVRGAPAATRKDAGRE